MTVASPAGAAWVALASLPGMGPASLRRLAEQWPDAGAAVAAVEDGVAGRALSSFGHGPPRTVTESWPRLLDVDREVRRLASRGTRVLTPADQGWPFEAELPDAPALLLAEGGTPDALEVRPRVAIVGTRAATPHGVADAFDLARTLAAQGVTVVSGLAIGVDAAAHEGALAGRGVTVGVVATGLDVVYPRRNEGLFDRVRSVGALVSETPFGTRPARHLFPVRNRIIAGLADAVVVVEATASGGARITAERALEYGRPVLAVPGSRRNAAAAGCNALIADGAIPLLDPEDVFVALGLTSGARQEWAATRRPPPGADGTAVLAALGGEPATADQIAARTALGPGQVSSIVLALERTGWVSRSRGMVWPR